MPLRRRRPRGLVDELQSGHRTTIGVLLAVLLLSLLSSGYLILVGERRVEAYVALTREARDAREGMLDQETAVRGWLATGDRAFLEDYASGRRATQAAKHDLIADVERTPSVTDPVFASLLAAHTWQTWADNAARRTFTGQQRAHGELRDFLLEGKRLFDSYRAADEDSARLFSDRRQHAVNQQNGALITILAAYVTVLCAGGYVTARRRRHLQASVLTPLDDLLEVINQLRGGELDARAAATSVPELDAVGTALGALATEVERAHLDATQRERRLALLASRFEMVVRVSREVAGSLSIRYVASAVTGAATDLLGAPTALWLRGEDQEFHAVHRASDAHGVRPPAGLVPPAVVLRVAADAVPATEDDIRGYPSVLAGNVIAVLEVDGRAVDEDSEEVLFALLSTAAAALESARLHSETRELADRDGLTHLPNRRRFEADLATEWDRCRRYGRPLSLVMMDLDHFKRLNDEHGHLLGDQVLRDVATALGQVLRSTDTAYRYGGEEVAVLLRETSLEHGVRAAERLRAAVAKVRAGDPEVRVTTSAGVAARRTTMAHHTELVAAADAALYRAKQRGRDRVEAVDDQSGDVPPTNGTPTRATPGLESRS